MAGDSTAYGNTSPVLKFKTLEAFREKASATKELGPIFEPQSIAVVGASPKETSVGYAVFKNLLINGYKGTLYPVNLTHKSVMGVKCYPSVKEIEDPIDLAVVVIPPKAIPQLIRDCGKKGVKGMIIISAGFKEAGPEGLDLEIEITNLAREAGIAILGPNCLGIINTDPALTMNASFARRMSLPGNIAFMSQSGALCTSILDYALGNNIGFSKFISFGNKADINENDLLRYLGQDPQTDVILMYVEDLTDGPTFMHIAREITEKSGKPVLAIKTGRTAEGAKAAASHTGSMAGTDTVYDAVMMQAGVIRVDTVQDLFDLAMAFSNKTNPSSDKVAIVTNAGGPGILTTDACIRNGLKLAQFTEETKDKLRAALPPTASVKNPVDVIGDARNERYKAALQGVLEDENTGGAIVILTPQTMTDIDDIANVVADLSDKSDKPILTSFMGLVDVSSGVDILRNRGVPHYRFPEDAARVYSRLWNYKQWLARPRAPERVFEVDRKAVQDIIDETLNAGRTQLPDWEALKILQHYGLPVVLPELVKDETELETACQQMAFPVVMKIASPDILHKTDVGGVVINIQDLDTAKETMRTMISMAQELRPHADIWGVTVQEMASKGREVILGSTRDPNFGPLLMFGMGGIYTEAMKDVTFRIAPMRQISARNMLKQIRGKQILEGFRGEPPVDFDTLQECLERLSQLVVEFPIIQELDMNPLIAYPDGAKVVDGRIILKPEE